MLSDAEVQRGQDEDRLAALSCERMQRHRQKQEYVWVLAGWDMEDPDHQPGGEAYEEMSNALLKQVIKGLAAKIVDRIKV